MESIKNTIINKLNIFINSLDNYDEIQLININENLNKLLDDNITVLIDEKELTKDCIEALFIGYTIKNFYRIN